MHARMTTQKATTCLLFQMNDAKYKEKGRKYSLKCVVITTYSWTVAGRNDVIINNNPFLKSYHEKSCMRTKKMANMISYK